MQLLPFIISAMGVLFGLTVVLFVVVGGIYITYKRIKGVFVTEVPVYPVDLMIAIAQNNVTIEATSQPTHIQITLPTGQVAQISSSGGAWALFGAQWHPILFSDVIAEIKKAEKRPVPQPVVIVREERKHNNRSERHAQPPQEAKREKQKPANGAWTADSCEAAMKKYRSWSDEPEFDLPKGYRFYQAQDDDRWYISRTGPRRSND